MNWMSVTDISVIVILFFILIHDSQKQMIADYFCGILGSIGIFTMISNFEGIFWDRILGAFIITIPMIWIDLLYQKAFGGGDIKLMCASGLLLGWKRNITAFILGLFFSLVAVILIFLKKRKMADKIIMGPFFSMGIWISYWIK